MRPALSMLFVFLLSFIAPLEAGAKPALEVVDANGKSVGPVINTHEQATSVAVQHGDQAFVLFVNANGLAVPYNEAVYFESGDCSGLAFIRVPDSTDVAPRAGIGGDTTVYGADRSASPQTITVGTRSRESDSLGCFAASFTITVLPAIPLFNFDDAFSGPFRATLK